MSDQQRRVVMRCTWPGETQSVPEHVVYWIEGESLPGFPGTPPWDSFHGRTADRLRVPATADEVGRWRDAVAAYVREVESAADGLQDVRAEVGRRRRRPAGRLAVIRRRLAERLERAEESYTARTAAAERAYRPVRQEVEALVAVAKEEERAARERKWAREEAERLARVAARDRWKARWADVARAADLRVWSWEYAGQTLLVLRHDALLHRQPALTAREVAKILVVLAGRGCTRVEWGEDARRPAEEVVGPGGFSAWWRDVLSATVNTRTLRAAEQEIVSTTERVGAALHTAGSPGIRTFTVNGHDSVRGWRLALDWPRHVAPPSVELPVLPWAPAGDRWRYGNYDGSPRGYGTLTLTPGWSPPGSVGFAEVWTETIYYSHKRKKWASHTPAWFAWALLRDEISHPGPGHGDDFTFRLAEHADAREFVPFVVALAGMVTTALLDTARHHGAAL